MNTAAAVSMPITASDSHGAKVWMSSAARDQAAHAAKGAQRTWPGVVWVASVAGAAVPVV